MAESEQHLRLILGDLAVALALARAENDALREQLAARPPIVPVPTAPDAQAPA